MANQDSLIIETVANTTSEVSNLTNHPVWFWLCIAQFILLLVLHLKHFFLRPIIVSKAESKELKKPVKNEINMNALMDNITKSGKLYKQLSKICHPDRFVNNPSQHMAEEIFKEITQSKRNYEGLIHLKNRAVKELNINL